VPTYNAENGRLERISYDRNKDGKADAWLFMDGAQARRAELDENGDGSVGPLGTLPVRRPVGRPKGRQVTLEASWRRRNRPRGLTDR
jgi:hypothetical protein